ncbi:mechanosensitive ion channel family protein [Halalkalicoccus subterraneus]|uniref:mechanosensitive ion channel family protein n=1 Tax=Halalkalicoccus subterraneus TaxID=2675002 RepID=UPI000EFC057E|nr:mechanosensitive ion channel family protein [Halalkalicoccus subterraneus]
MFVAPRLVELLSTYATLLSNVATFLLTFALVYAFGRAVVEPAARYLMDLRGTEPTLRRGLQQVLAVAVVVASIVTGLWVAGLGYLLDRSALVVAALTVALGFAAQDVVGNVVSGVFIVTDPKFNIGDWIRWEGGEGIIEDIDFRATRVRTFDNEIVTVPNAALTTTTVVNPVLNDRLRIELPLELGHGADLEAAVSVLVSAAEEHPDVLDTPEPSVRIVGIGGPVRLSARIWIGDPTRESFARVRSEYAREVTTRLHDARIDLDGAAPTELDGEIGVELRGGGPPSRDGR